jgi:hypothetical protein
MPDDDIEMQPITGSSQIAAVGYRPESQTLRVEFANGAVYEYEGVAQQVFDGLMAAPSVGSYFHMVKAAGYGYRRVG